MTPLSKEGFAIRCPAIGGIRATRENLNGTLTGRTIEHVERWDWARVKPVGAVDVRGNGPPTVWRTREEAEEALQEAIEERRTYEITGIHPPTHEERTFHTPGRFTHDGNGRKIILDYVEHQYSWAGFSVFQLTEQCEVAEYQETPDAERHAEQAKKEMLIARQRQELAKIQQQVKESEAELAAETGETDRDTAKVGQAEQAIHPDTGEALRNVQQKTLADGTLTYRARKAGQVSSWNPMLSAALHWLEQEQEENRASVPGPIGKDDDGVPLGGFGVGAWRP